LFGGCFLGERGSRFTKIVGKPANAKMVIKRRREGWKERVKGASFQGEKREEGKVTIRDRGKE